MRSDTTMPPMVPPVIPCAGSQGRGEPARAVKTLLAAMQLVCWTAVRGRSPRDIEQRGCMVAWRMAAGLGRPDLPAVARNDVVIAIRHQRVVAVQIQHVYSRGRVPRSGRAGSR